MPCWSRISHREFSPLRDLFLLNLYQLLAEHRPPGVRISACLRADRVGFIEAVHGSVSRGLDHADEFAPRTAETFVAAVIGGLDDIHRGPLPWFHAVYRRNRSGDRQAYLEIEDL